MARRRSPSGAAVIAQRREATGGGGDGRAHWQIVGTGMGRGAGTGRALCRCGPCPGAGAGGGVAGSTVRRSTVANPTACPGTPLAPVPSTLISIPASLRRFWRLPVLSTFQLQLPHAHHQQPFEGTQLALFEDRAGPVRAHGTLLAQAYSAGHTAAALQSVVAPFARLDGIAATAWTRDTIGPAHLSQVIGSLLVIVQVRDQVFQRVAPM